VSRLIHENTGRSQGCTPRYNRAASSKSDGAPPPCSCLVEFNHDGYSVPTETNYCVDVSAHIYTKHPVIRVKRVYAYPGSQKSAMNISVVSVWGKCHAQAAWAYRMIHTYFSPPFKFLLEAYLMWNVNLFPDHLFVGIKKLCKVDSNSNSRYVHNCKMYNIQYTHTHTHTHTHIYIYIYIYIYVYISSIDI